MFYLTRRKEYNLNLCSIKIENIPIVFVYMYIRTKTHRLKM